MTSVAQLTALDTYTRQARLKSALIVLLPALLTLIAYFPDEATSWIVIPGLLATCGVTVLLAQMARSIGKRTELVLFRRWGGKPTTHLLRHRNATNSTLLERRHRQLQNLIPDLSLPTPEQEKADPVAADAIYDACVAALRERTRDRERFHLLFDENCSYGFRRNLWGMKSLGLTLSLLGTIAIVGLFVQRLRLTGAIPFLPLALGFMNAGLLLWWIAIITPEWVKEQAYTYAHQLLVACETFETATKKAI